MLSSPREAGPSDLGFLAFTTFLQTLIQNGINRVFRSEEFSSPEIVGISHLISDQQSLFHNLIICESPNHPHRNPGC